VFSTPCCFNTNYESRKLHVWHWSMISVCMVSGTVNSKVILEKSKNPSWGQKYNWVNFKGEGVMFVLQWYHQMCVLTYACACILNQTLIVLSFPLESFFSQLTITLTDICTFTNTWEVAVSQISKCSVYRIHNFLTVSVSLEDENEFTIKTTDFSLI